MYFAIVENGIITSHGRPRDLWPEVSFALAGPNAEFLQENNAVPVRSDPPFDPVTQDLEVVEPYLVNGVAYNRQAVSKPPPPVVPRWTAFGVAVMSHPGIKAALNAAVAAGEIPLALGLATGLSDAAKGDPKVFLGHDGVPGTWTMALASGLISAELAAEIQSAGEEYDLPADFIAGLAA